MDAVGNGKALLFWSVSYIYDVISTIESQKGAITIQRCSVENQKGAITIDFEFEQR